MNKLNLAPDQSSYSVAYSGEQVSAQNTGPAGNYRRNLFNNAKAANVTWICDATEYAYIAQCERAAKKAGGLTFLIDLLLDDSENLIEYLAQFVPGTFSLASVAGETFTVNAVLDVAPVPYDVTTRPFVVDSGLSDRRLVAGYGSFTLTGFPAGRIDPPRKLSAGTGAFVLTGVPILFGAHNYLHAATGIFTLTGKSVNFVDIPVFNSYPELSREWQRFTWIQGLESADINTLAQAIEREFMEL